MIGGNRSTQYFDPPKSIPKFEFSRLESFQKIQFKARIDANVTMFSSIACLKKIVMSGKPPKLDKIEVRKVLN